MQHLGGIPLQRISQGAEWGPGSSEEHGLQRQRWDPAFCLQVNLGNPPENTNGAIPVQEPSSLPACRALICKWEFPPPPLRARQLGTSIRVPEVQPADPAPGKTPVFSLKLGALQQEASSGCHRQSRVHLTRGKLLRQLSPLTARHSLGDQLGSHGAGIHSPAPSGEGRPRTFSPHMRTPLPRCRPRLRTGLQAERG